MPSLKSYENFVPVDNQLRMNTSGAPPADPQLANPLNALAFWDGEWVTLDAAGKVVRACNVASAGNASTARLAYPLLDDIGATDVQAHPEKFKSFFVGPYGVRWKTRVWSTAVVDSGTAIVNTFGLPLKIASISLSTPRGTRIVSGLVGHGGEGTDSDNIVARVIELRGDDLTIQIGKLPPTRSLQERKNHANSLRLRPGRKAEHPRWHPQVR